MFPLQLEELQTPADLGYMERVFVLDQTDAEAAAVLPRIHHNLPAPYSYCVCYFPLLLSLAPFLNPSVLLLVLDRHSRSSSNNHLAR